MLKKLSYIAIFILILLLSEFIFIFNSQKMKIISTYAIFQAQKEVNIQNVQKAVNFFTWAAEINIKSLAKSYPGLIPENYAIKVTIPQTNLELKDNLTSYINNINLSAIFNSEEGYLARVFYNLATISAKNKEDNLAQPFFQTAVYLNPELSHFHVALANYYLLKGNKEKAIEAIDYCLKFKDPQEHCIDYQNFSLAQNAPEEIGFLDKELDKYYESR